MNKLFVAFELNVQEEFCSERHRAVFYKEDRRMVASILEANSLDDLINRVKRYPRGDEEIVLVAKGYGVRPELPAGRWGKAKVLKFYS